MRVQIISSIFVVTAVSLTGCGFKSDLVLPEPDAEPQLFENDSELELTETIPPFLPSATDGTDDDIMLDKVTATATAGRILVTPGTEDSPEAGAEVSTAGVTVSNESDEPITDDGILVDLTDLTRDIEQSQ